jgi:hypothetical protein
MSNWVLIITNILRTFYSIFMPFAIQSIEAEETKVVLLPQMGNMLLLLLGLLIRLRKKAGASPNQPKTNLGLERFTESREG